MRGTPAGSGSNSSKLSLTDRDCGAETGARTPEIMAIKDPWKFRPLPTAAQRKNRYKWLTAALLLYFVAAAAGSGLARRMIVQRLRFW